jgi:hypothetical protein
MASLSRVPSPGSPFEGRSAWVVALVVVGLGLAIAKPWNPPPRAGPDRLPATSAVPAAPSVPPEATRLFDPTVLGIRAPDPEWAVFAVDRGEWVPFVGPPSGDPEAEASGEPGPGTSGEPGPGASGTPEPVASPILGGPVIELGSADDVAALALNHPADTVVATVRLWRFRDGAEPERVSLLEVPGPWPGARPRVFVHRDARLPANVVLRWRPGLYRLDLLADPGGRIRSILLVVRDGVRPLPAPVEPVEPPAISTTRLERLPTAATFWSYGRYLSGWADRPPAPSCRVAEIWRATADLRDPCHPISVGDAHAIGVNLPGRPTIRSIRLREVDPLPGLLTVGIRTDVPDRPGLVTLTHEHGSFPDGIYQLDVVTSDDAWRWLIEVGTHRSAWPG